MVRLADLPAVESEHLFALPCPEYSTTASAPAPDLATARLAIVSTAGLHLRGDDVFGPSEAAYRVLPGDVLGADVLMSHTSVNFDRTGFTQDVNVAFPIDRAREMVASGELGSLARHHYAYSGAGLTPEHYERAGLELAGLLEADRVDAVLLLPV